MTLFVKPTRRAWSLLVLALVIGACDNDSLDPTEPAVTPETVDQVSLEEPSFSSAFAGGIPFGAFHQPTSAYGATFNGALRNIGQGDLLRELAAIKARGGKVVLNLVGSEARYKDRAGNFSMSMWKASMDRFKKVNFDKYINDGTVIAAFLMDEPHNKTRWRGKPVPYATIDEMARYSKARYPKLPTVIRAYPTWLAKHSGNYKYLDAAWIQFVNRFGDVRVFMRENISAAQRKGLGVIVGFNIKTGGTNRRPLSPTQLRSWGAELLSTTYPCAFISWKYDARYLGQAAIKGAMADLQKKARSRASKSCRGGKGQTSGGGGGGGGGGDDGGGNSPRPPAPSRPPTPSRPPSQPAAIQLRASGSLEKQGKRHYLLLTWSGARGSTVDLYREGAVRRRTENDGRTKVLIVPRRRATEDFKVCQRGTSKCSKTVTVRFK